MRERTHLNTHSLKLYMLSAIEEQYHIAFFEGVFKMSTQQRLHFSSINELHVQNCIAESDRIKNIL